MTETVSRDREVYWAGDEPDAVQREALNRIKQYYMDVRQSGRGVLWRRAYLAYYGLELMTGAIHAGSALRPSGEQGELLMVKINELRNILQHILNIVTRDPPIYEPQAHDTTTESEAACDLARDILTNLVREQDVDGKNRRAVEWACVLGEGYLRAEWDQGAGPLGPVQFDQTGEVKKNAAGLPDRKRLGDVRIDVYGPHDVIHDVRTPGWAPQWCVVRDWVNRFDLIAKYCKEPPKPQPTMPQGMPAVAFQAMPQPTVDPAAMQLYQQAVELAAERKRAILALDTRDVVDKASLTLWTFGANLPSDDVAVYTLYHKRSDALPGGRMFVFVDGDTWLFDGALPYEEIPVERVAAADWLDRGYTYSPAFDLTGIQEAIDSFWTTFVSTADLAGVPNFLIPETSNIGVEELPGGGREVRYRVDKDAPNAGQPMLMVVPEPPAVVVKGMEIAPAVMERLSGVNSVVRGDPAENIKAGNYAALVQVQSAEFFTPIKRSDVHALERIAKHSLGMYATFATEDRAVVTEGGPRGRRLLSYTKKKLEPVKDVIATMSNPMRETTAGRLMLADKMLGMVDPLTGKSALTPEQWIGILDTGRFEPATDPVQRRKSLIEWENEEIQAGRNPQVTPFDNHKEHIEGVHGVDGHLCVAESPEARTNPQIMTALSQHIQAHEAAMAAQLTGQQGVMPGAGPPPPMEKPGQPGQAPPGQPPGPNATGALNAGPGAQDAGVTMPAPATPAGSA